MNKFLLSFFTASLFAVLPVQALTVDSLRCDSRDTPLGVDSTQPRLSWLPQAPERGENVTAYQVQVASTAAALSSGGDLWDSGKVVSSENANTAYGGTALNSSQQVFWKVRVWNGSDVASAWSAPASWTMGVLKSADWAGQWIMAGRAASGYHSTGVNTATGNVKWVQVDLGSAQAITSVRLHPTNNLNLNLPAYGFPVRFQITMSNDATFASGVTTITDQTGANYANPGANIVAFAATGSARYVRVTPTTLASVPSNNIVTNTYVFSLSQIEVIAGGQNVALGKTVSAADSLERNSEWSKASLTDGIGLVGSKAVTQSDRFRTNFTVASGLKRALVSVCGLGQYEMTMNGVKVGADFLTPNWSSYNKTCLYNTYDVTSMLATGANAAGVALGNGFYNLNGGRYALVTPSYGPRRVIAQIRLEYNNGSVTTIGTNTSWKWVPGPATFSCIYGGEDVDGRLDETGWDTASFNSAAWLTPQATTGPAGATLRGVSLDSEPTRALQTFTPAAMRLLSTGITVYDLGQNAAQIPTITATGPAGSTVRMTSAEYVNGNGTLAKIVDNHYMTYTLKGTGSAETFTPKFFYMGYRYLQVELRDPAGNVSGSSVPVLGSISSRAITSASNSAGSFTSSNSLFNDITKLIYWAQVSNTNAGVITDCPQREKLGYQEEIHLNGPALRYPLDMRAQFEKVSNDLIDAQLANGMSPAVVPAFNGTGSNWPEWGASSVIVPWQQYEFAGDLALLARNYSSAKRYVDHMSSKVSPSGSYLLNYGLGDWYDVGPNDSGYSQNTPLGLTATATYYQCALAVSQWAQLLGNTTDANTYAQLAANIRTAFNTKFLDSATHTYGVGTFTSGTTTYGSQTSNAMPLALGMVDEANKAGVLKAIVDDVKGRGSIITAGDVGYHYLIRALADNGRSDVLFAVNNRITRPGYGYILSTGATSLTEAWDASPANRHSLNHLMLGQAMEWFYHDVAGIQSDPAGPGFKKIIIKPAMVGTLGSVNTTYRSVRGNIVSNWTSGASGLTMNVTIPVASTATIYVPAASAGAVQEGGVAASSAAGVQFLRMENNAAVFAVGSGSYAFSSLAVPAAPTGLTANADASSVRLTWPASFDASQYNVKRATTSGGPYTTVASGFTDTTFSDATAAFGSTYYYVVTATNSAAESLASNEASITLSTPAAPGSFIATAGDGVIQLSWSKVAGVSGYRIKRSTNSGGPYTTTVISSTPGTTYVDNGLSNSTTYYYTVTALVFSNEGSPSAQASATPAASASLVSRAFGGAVSTNYEGGSVGETIDKAFDGSTSTKWYESVASSNVWLQYQFANGQSWAITRYQLTSANDVPGRDPAAWRFEGSNNGTQWVTLDTQTNQTFSGRGQTNTYNFSNTTPYRYYRLFITADLVDGNGIQLAELALFSSAADAGDKTAPVLTLPANISVAATSNDTAKVTFNATASDAVAGILPVSSTPASGFGFSVGTTVVQCSATDAAGNTATGTFTITVTPAYAAPSGLSATAVSESQIRLNWTDNATGEGNYQVQSAPAGSGAWMVQTGTLAPGSTSFIVAGLSASTNYDFRIKATGPAGSSAYATTSAATPAGVGDGIPGAWRYQYFGNGLSASGNAAATADPDGDGMTNAQEYAAGTNPKDAASSFKVTQITPGQSGWLISFSTVSGKNYRLESSTTLQSGSWSIVQNNITGTGGVVEISDGVNSNGAKRFYRVVVLP